MEGSWDSDTMMEMKGAPLRPLPSRPSTKPPTHINEGAPEEDEEVGAPFFDEETDNTEVEQHIEKSKTTIRAFWKERSHTGRNAEIVSWMYER